MEFHLGGLLKLNGVRDSPNGEMNRLLVLTPKYMTHLNDSTVDKVISVQNSAGLLYILSQRFPEAVDALS